MSVSSAPAHGPSADRGVHLWWILLLGALALLWVATARRIACVEALTDHPTWTVDAPVRDNASSTGYVGGQRRLVVPGHHTPSFWWIMEAQQAAAGGQWRLRHIDYDAVPEGRDPRRTSPYRWWLIGVGRLHALFTGEPLGYAIERATLVADPLLLALLLVAGAAYSARCFGSWAAVGFVAGGGMLFPLAANFQPGAPDSHSLAWVIALGSLLPVLAAMRPHATPLRPRLHFAFAGVLGGVGFWNDAPSQAPVLLAVLLGGLGAEFMRWRGGGAATGAPLPWRTWGLAGALTTLAAALFEFAPRHFGWSLDAVHPVHAVAWWGIGEMLHAAGVWFAQGRAGFGGRSVAMLIAGVLAAAAWPVVGLAGGSSGLLASDFYALKLANHPRVGLASSLGAWFGRPGDIGAKWAVLLSCLLLPALLWRVFPLRTGRPERGAMVLVVVAAMLAAVLGAFQLRWWNLFDVFLLAGLTLWFAGSEAGARLRTAAGLLPILPGLLVGFPSATKPAGGGFSPSDAQTLIARDFAYSLVKRGGGEPAVLFSTPLFSSAAAFYGGFRVVVSNDDGNRDGYERAVRLASATTEQEMSILLKSRGVTHVALPLWDPLLDHLVRIGLGVPPDQALPQQALVVALREWDFPPWIRPIDCLVPREPGFGDFELRAFALQPEQEQDISLSQLADFFLERGQIREAQAVTASLKTYTRSAAALGAMANVQLAARDGAALKETLATLLPLLSRRSARNLPVDRRISLGFLLYQTRQPDLAREQIAAGLEGLDAATLRTLTPGALVNLVSISRELGLTFPGKELEHLAWDLIPPAARHGLASR